MKIVFAALLLCVTLNAQENTAPPNASTPQQPQAVAQKSVQKKKTTTAQKSAPVPLPEYDVVLSPSADVWTNLPDKFHPEVEGCDGSGNPYFSISGSGNLYLSITRSDDMQIVGLTPKGVVSFDAGKVTDVTSLHFVKSFIAPSDLYVLAIWIDPEKLEAKKGKEIDPEDCLINGEARFYIVRFGLDGSYKKAHKLDFDFLPMQIAAFDGGNLLVAGLDKSNRAHVALLDSSGQLLNYLRLPKDVVDDPKAASKAFEQYGLPTSGTDGTVPPETVAVFAAAFASVLPHKGNVLFSREMDARIYEIRNSGEVRMVKIKSPPKRAFQDKLQSDQDWFAYGDNGLYRISPETGELLGFYQLKDQGERQDQIACVYDGKFVGIRHAKGRLTLLTGVAELAAQQPQPPAQPVSK